MDISAKIGLRQTNKLGLTQQLLQSIKMLQLSNIELAEQISSELIENPVLEEEDVSAVSSSNEPEELLSNIDKELSGDENSIQRKEEWEGLYEGTANTPYDSTDDDKKRNYIENIVAQRETLKEHLLSQATLVAKDDDELYIFETIITSLDDNGFLNTSIEDIAASTSSDIDSVKKAILIINNLDPIGCGVKEVKDSLAIQASHIYPDDIILKKILEDYFVDLEKLNHAKIAAALDISPAEVIRKSKLVHSLDPFPGIKYSSKQIRYIVPDVDVRCIDDEIIVTINDEWIPKIKISAYYKSILKKKEIDAKLAEYLKEKIKAANNLLGSISNRRSTIIKVVSAVMRHQREFIINGAGNLKPLVYADIASEVGLHESTISRVANNKFIQTSWGVFELKHFFVSKLKSDNNTDYSSEKIMNLIKEIVSEEDPKNPLSDIEILNKLQQRGINLARRTIAKYRTILNISSSNIRKKLNFMKEEESI